MRGFLTDTPSLTRSIMAVHNRPLSPHLQVYRLPITGLISITHRITGVLLSGALLFAVIALFAIAAGPEQFASFQACLAWPPSRLAYWGIIFALYFHLCHGIRHLIWDVGKTFEKAALTRYAVIELGVAVLLFLITFIS
ncbi:succinate dehydrogenase, cytochrome b556 subunit [Methylomonas sp. MS20]|uniref:succinate dehydrogenase, cytochrome b556 subunit n=1 Tax=unclassified Methylomonas TaxID=2608980 RepID=UPI0028A54523|nr:succinate dehydrogenase, cytochrome b556 subunit [Methylomonas sp. MV1]MDT4328853.1 succinate dehydrogenase, cytochrome b556 subunit [Methylomonas sp. MV1]